MSLSIDRRYIKCDGDGCKAVAPLLVGLKNDLNRGYELAGRSVTGWLLIANQGSPRHTYPKRSTSYLNVMADNE